MIVGSPVTIQMPGGCWHDGERIQDVLLRRLDGADELSIAELAGSAPVAKLVTDILDRSIVRIGPVEPVPRSLIQSLTVGDREALLLNLRRLTLGERIQCVLMCPHEMCKERLDLDLTVSQLLMDSYAHARQRHHVKLSIDDQTYLLTLRLPTGADQENAIDRVRDGIDHAAESVLQDCVEDVRTGNGVSISPESWPNEFYKLIPAKMLEFDPQAEIRLVMDCPYCGQSFGSIFDTAHFFLNEIQRSAQTLYEQVHTLASSYHWDESSILQMPSSRRWVYLDLIDKRTAVFA